MWACPSQAYICSLHLSCTFTESKICLCHFALVHPYSCLQRALALCNETSLPLQQYHCLSFPWAATIHPCFLVTKQRLYYAFKTARPFLTYIQTWPQTVSWLQLLSRCTSEIRGMMLQKHSPHVIRNFFPSLIVKIRTGFPLTHLMRGRSVKR